MLSTEWMREQAFMGSHFILKSSKRNSKTIWNNYVERIARPLYCVDSKNYLVQHEAPIQFDVINSVRLSANEFAISETNTSRQASS